MASRKLTDKTETWSFTVAELIDLMAAVIRAEGGQMPSGGDVGDSIRFKLEGLNLGPATDGEKEVLLVVRDVTPEPAPAPAE